MLSFVGIFIVLGMVFGGYLLAGGMIEIIIKALPFEMMMIGGAAVGALVLANSLDVVKKVAGSFGKIMKGPRWKRDDYRDLLCLLFLLTRLMKTQGVIGLEPHIEQPAESDIFSRFPRIVGDTAVVALICDTLSMVTMNLDDPHQVEDFMERQLEKLHDEAMKPAKAMGNMADGLPALGIVAAVLWVIKTMAPIDQPVEILGKLIGGALVGTFLGVFLSYGMMGPLGSRLKQILEEEHRFLSVIRDTVTAHLHGHAPQVSIEIGRGNVPSKMQPSFHELDEAVGSLGQEQAA